MKDVPTSSENSILCVGFNGLAHCTLCARLKASLSIMRHDVLLCYRCANMFTPVPFSSLTLPQVLLFCSLLVSTAAVAFSSLHHAASCVNARPRAMME